MYRKRFLNLYEVTEFVNNSDDEEFNFNDVENLNLTILPPEKVDNISDCEEIEENDLILPKLETLPNEIAGEVELFAQVDNVNEDCVSLNDDIPSTSKAAKKKLQCIPKWTKRFTEFSKSPLNLANEKRMDLYRLYGSYDPMQLFNLFIDNEVFDLIVKCTNEYSWNDKNDTSFQTNQSEIRKFLGILYMTGINTMPNINFYWSNNIGFNNVLIKNSMSRDRFKRIKSYLHVCNNKEIDKLDRFAKVAPLNNLLNKKFLQFDFFAHELSIDEQMIPYYGRHSCKMFIKGKPIRFGYKYWCLCSSEGYLFQFLPYTGASTNLNRDIGLGESVVLSLLQYIKNPNQHTVTFDNFFSSYKLLNKLSQMGFFATGTVRENRTSNALLTESKTFKKTQRGTNDYCFDRQNEIGAIRWNDNAVVTVLSNCKFVEPTVKTKRYDRKNKKMISIPVPNAIDHYNKTMGGVDLFDNAISNYRIQLRGKKWYWPLIINIFDGAMVNAWKLHCLLHKNDTKSVMPQANFRVFVIECLLRVENIQIPLLQSASASSNIRSDSIGHNIARGDKRIRCRQCKNQTIFFCEKCKVGVHPKCFKDYHK